MKTVKMKQHPNFPNYVVDENGEVYSKLKGFDNGTGYRLYALKNKDGNRVYQLGHRFTYEAWNEERIPVGMDIHHKNHVRDDNHIDNLDCVTRSENLKAAGKWRKSKKVSK